MTSPWRPRPDRGSPPHERASALLVERLDGSLGPEDATWLDAHLADCHACRALGDAFESDRAELRSLRRQPIEPPRDLWARTAAALEQEARSGRSRRSRRHPAPAPMGAAAGLLVVAVVLGATMLSGQPSVTPEVAMGTGSPSSTLLAVSLPPSVAPTTTPVASAEATRLEVPSGDVPYIAQDDDGNNVFLQLGVSEVCSTDGADCAPIEPSSPRVLELPNSPGAVIRSPNEKQLIVVDEGAKGEGGAITLVPVPTPVGSEEPPVTDPPVTDPPLTPSPTPPSTTPPATTPGPTTSPTSTPVPPGGQSPTAPSTSPTPPGAAEPTATATPTRTSTEVPTTSPTASPTGTPAPSPTATAIAIAEDVVVDGTTAAFSADGRFLAFSARPADGSHGPDIYLWVTDGTEPAAPITTDHRSVFAGWLGDMILGSRIVDGADGADPSAAPSFGPDAVLRSYGEAFLVDPETGTSTTVSDQPLWRPSVDPTGARAVYWDGTLGLDESGDPRTEIGRLVLGPWAAALTGSGSPDASAGLSPSEEPEATSRLPSFGSSASPETAIDVLAEGPLVDWDARWDETGTHLAVWIADPDDPTIGKLSLYIVDPETGRLNADMAPLRDARALPGFAIGQGRLVWATPPGQDAEASHVNVLAWTDDGVGQVESRPAEDIVVIR